MENKIREMIQSKTWKLDDSKKYMEKEIESAKRVLESGNIAEIGKWLPIYAERIKEYNAECTRYTQEIEELEWLIKSIQ